MYATVKFEIVISKQGTTKETGGHRTQNLFEKIKELRSLDLRRHILSSAQQRVRVPNVLLRLSFRRVHHISRRRALLQRPAPPSPPPSSSPNGPKASRRLRSIHSHLPTRRRILAEEVQQQRDRRSERARGALLHRDFNGAEEIHREQRWKELEQEDQTVIDQTKAQSFTRLHKISLLETRMLRFIRDPPEIQIRNNPQEKEEPFCENRVFKQQEPSIDS
ncbi:Uncharacterized protein Rs2_31572 [Raphanus sativus]|nr:Uncharacterized protein Rs2_31572 [Raphanus sativus]